MDKQRVSVVTGGASGIGREICVQLLARGDTVISVALETGDLRHERLQSRVIDLTDRKATESVVHDIAMQYRVNTLVHNAGAIRPATLADARPEDLDMLVNLHLGSAIQLAQAFLPGMRAAHFGRIVLIASRAALGLPGRTHYSATKAGLIGLARTWALELAADGITVNVVAPGPIRGTAMFHAVIERGSEREVALATGIPVKRLGEPDDVARAVGFFADAQNSFVTGQVLYVCGGASVGTLSL
jgi:NAD(P)-dependent dehydrogenase (short-subunit alcohol dehydrogenase family)